MEGTRFRSSNFKEADEALLNRVYMHNHQPKIREKSVQESKRSDRSSFLTRSPTPAHVGPSTYNVSRSVVSTNIVFKKYQNGRYLDEEIKSHVGLPSPAHYSVRSPPSTELARRLNLSDRASSTYLENFGLWRCSADVLYDLSSPISKPQRIPISLNRSDRFASPRRRNLNCFIGPGSYNLRQ